MESTEEKISELKKLAKKCHDAKQRRHYDIARLFLQGRRKKDIAEIFGLSRRAIYNIIKQYEKDGTDGLKLGKSTGRKTKLCREQEQELHDTICGKLPKDVGFEPFCNWTGALACEYVRLRFGVEFSYRGMVNLLHRLGLSFTRPTYTLAKADPKKQEEFLKRWEEIKKNSLTGILPMCFTKTNQ